MKQEDLRYYINVLTVFAFVFFLPVLTVVYKICLGEDISQVNLIATAISTIVATALLSRAFRKVKKESSKKFWL